MKLAIFDLDGTLFDTKNVNYYAYREALSHFGYELDYDYFCEYCSGKHYRIFLPPITSNDEKILLEIHQLKKEYYNKYLDKAVPNRHLLEIIKLMRREYKVAIVTTASRKNCVEILNKFEAYELFDLILTQEEIKNSKPDPEGFLKAIDYFGVEKGQTLIFEDSDIGLEAANRIGVYYVRVYGFN